MAHKTLIGGTAYEATGGRTLIGGTGYGIKKGRTLVGGTGYDINFSKGVEPSYTGEYDVYGTPEQGWIELLTSGVLTIPGGAIVDIYVISSGERGENAAKSTARGNGGKGGDGGAYKELFGVALSETTSVTIGARGLTSQASNVGDYSSSGGTVVGKGGAGYVASSNTSGKAGGGGRVPFTGKNPMSQGYASRKLGAGGGGGGYLATTNDATTYTKYGSGGSYGGGDGVGAQIRMSTPSANSGSGGGGGVSATNKDGYYNGTMGATGIAIVRWGY